MSYICQPTLLYMACISLAMLAAPMIFVRTRDSLKWYIWAITVDDDGFQQPVLLRHISKAGIQVMR